MANVGKSSTFNLLASQSVASENYPFCTIEPNQGMVQIRDERFEYLCKMFEPEKRVEAMVQVTDIAGLVRGAHEGLGLGNEFLSHISVVDALYHLIRVFPAAHVLHTEGQMDPLRDIDIINNELIQKDLHFIQHKLTDATKKHQRNPRDPQIKLLYNTLIKAQTQLKTAKRIAVVEWTSEEIEVLNQFLFITAKPTIYLMNMSSDQYIAHIQNQPDLTPLKKSIEDKVQSLGGGNIVYFSVEFEQDLQLDDDFNKQYRQYSQVDNIIKSGYSLLNLQYFFTVGKDEVKCWPIKTNTRAQDAAGQIHTDFVKGFISADVISFNSFQALAQSAITLFKKNIKKENKDYIVQDGDIIEFQIKIKK